MNIKSLSTRFFFSDLQINSFFPKQLKKLGAWFKKKKKKDNLKSSLEPLSKGFSVECHSEDTPQMKKHLGRPDLWNMPKKLHWAFWGVTFYILQQVLSLLSCFGECCNSVLLLHVGGQRMCVFKFFWVSCSFNCFNQETTNHWHVKMISFKKDIPPDDLVWHGLKLVLHLLQQSLDL